MKLTSDMKRLVREQRLGFVATVTPDGRPNLSPKGTLSVWDDERLFFADVASPGTVTNLRSIPWIEINVVDPILRKGYRFRGVGTVHVGDASHAHGLELLGQQGSSLTEDRVHSIVVIEIHDGAPMWSPAYDQGATEQEVVARWLRHHNGLHDLP